MALIKSGNYIGVIKSVTKKECETKDKKNKFNVIVFQINVNGEKNGIKTLKHEMSENYAVKYFKDFLKIKSKDLIDKPCNVVVIVKEFVTSDGEKGFCNEIKYINLLNENNEPIFMPREDTPEDIF